jgi:DNA-binding NarL/FixJ family response regulator/energy-coupling factor transporter ATP-binding protein EcfA2
VELVGRKRELSVVARALDDVAAGSTRILGVIGEAGIGKTALLAAIARLARARGLEVRQTRAAAHERYVPFAAIPRELAADVGSAALLVDDAHWADEASTDLLLDLLGRPPAEPYLLVVASRQRGSGPALRLLGEARRVAGFEELVVGPLDDDASLALLAGVDESVRERILEESHGNPLYLTEFARRPDALSCPLLASMEAELAALSEGARALAQGAAVAGDPFDPELAAAAAGVELDPGALDELVATDLARPVCGPTFAFRHPMVCRAVYHGTAPAWRLAAHERAAAALERRGASVALRARHVARYARPGDEAAVALLVEAAEGGAAAHWYETALRLVPDEGRAALLGPYGLALVRAGRLGEAREALAAADEPIACARVERLLGDPDAARRRLRAAYEATSDPAVAFELIPEGPEWAARAAATDDPLLLAALGDARVHEFDDAVLAANLPVVAQIARTQLLHERVDEAAATCARALEIARRTHQEDALVALHELRATVLWLQLDLDGALREAQAAEEVAARQGIACDGRLRAVLLHERGEATGVDAVLPPSDAVLPPSAVRALGSDAVLPPSAVRPLGVDPVLPASEARAACAEAERLLAAGDAAAAAELAEAVIASAAPLDAAEARLLAGRAHAAAGATAQAKAALQQVAADAGRGGANRLRDAAARELRALGTRITPRNRHVAGGELTPRERTVAELVAAGRTNKQVAAQLYLSEGTIENTLTRVYAKLGVRSRTQLSNLIDRRARALA